MATTLTRLESLEKTMTLIWRLLRNAISKEQTNRLLVVWQNSYDVLEAKVTELETTVGKLEGRVNDLL
jgi:polyhydroxyalkanoate synthesis regulator phasin